MTLINRRLATLIAALSALALCAALFAALGPAKPAEASSFEINSGHWDLVAEVDCVSETIELVAENHDTGTLKQLNSSYFKVTESNDDEQIAADQNRFDPDPLRALSHDEAEVVDGKMVLGFEPEYVNCGTSKPNVTFVRTGTATVPSGGRAAAYQNTPHTNTQIDSSTGTNLNQGVVTDQHEDRRWGFAVAGNYDLAIKASVTLPTGTIDVTETLSFQVS
ncbi:MAG: hypothetical protein ACT4OM_12525 [Actinomycetota bacterium]